MINVMFAGNEKVFGGMTITLLSMVKHTKCPINAYLLTMKLDEIDKRFVPISEEQRKSLEKILTEVNPKSSLKLIDLTDLFKEKMIDSVNIRSKFTPYSMLRLFADLLPDIPDKVIYLDTDVVVNNDIEPFFNMDIENYELAAVKDAFNWSDPKRWFMKFYFNAGVLLLNIKKIKETKMFEKTRKYCRYRKMLYMDQDALNLSAKKVLRLPLKYNSKDKYYPEIVLHHFCNVREGKVFLIGKWWHRIKPWEVDFVKTKTHAYDDILDKYQLLMKEFQQKNAD